MCVFALWYRQPLICGIMIKIPAFASDNHRQTQIQENKQRQTSFVWLSFDSEQTDSRK